MNSAKPSTREAPPGHNKATSEILNKFTQLKSKRHTWESAWADIADFVLPRRSGMDLSTTPGETFGELMYDTTANAAAQLLADGLQGYITTPTSRWFRIGYEAPSMKDVEEGKEWLEECEEIIAYLFGRTNFYEAINQIFLDGVTIGTATLYIEDDYENSALTFSARHPKEIYIETNSQGVVDTVFRHYKQTAKNIVQSWPDNLPTGFKEQMLTDPFREYEMIHAVFPREDRDIYKADKINKPFASFYILKESQHLLAEGGYDDNPYIVWRYRTSTNETYGRSPSWDALSDIKVSHQIMKTLIQSAHLAVQPPMMAPQEMQGNLNLTPNGVSWYVENNRRPEPIYTGGQYPVGRDMQAVVQHAIQQHFRTDYFLMWTQSMGQAKTATEVMEMQGEKAAIMGTIISRVGAELLNPMFDRVFGIALTNGWLPPIPEEMSQYAGAPMKIDYVGPLAQAAKRHWNTQAINQTLIQYVSLFEVFPELRHRVPTAELGRFLLEQGGFPEKLITDDAEYEQAVAQEQAQNAQAQEEMNGAAQADVYSKLTEAPQGGSPAEILLGA